MYHVTIGENAVYFIGVFRTFVIKKENIIVCMLCGFSFTLVQVPLGGVFHAFQQIKVNRPFALRGHVTSFL